MLVDAVARLALHLYHMHGYGIRINAVRRDMDEPCPAWQYDGRPFQQRKRIVHAGDTPDKERLFDKSADTVLL